MANQPSFWLLSRELGWRLTDESGAPLLRDAPAVRLGAAPDGPLALNSSDGSLGGLVLPRGMAIDSNGIVYLLGTSRPWLKRFDPETRKFVVIPGLGGDGSDARLFQVPASFAIAGYLFYIADQTQRRIVAFGLGDLALRHVWQRDWNPVDVTARGTCAYILDAAHGRVYRHCGGNDCLHLVIDDPSVKNWSRIALDRDGRIYLFDFANRRLDIFDAAGNPVGSATDSSLVAGRFDPPPIRLDSRQRFCLPESLARLCDRRAPAQPPPIERPLFSCSAQARLIFNREGEPATVEPAESPGPAPYRASEAWFSDALDSKIYHCQWHRIQVKLDALPPGTQLVVSTITSSQKLPQEEISGPNNDFLWETRYAIAGPPFSKPGASTARHVEFLVQSHEGQYLWLRLQLSGDGFSSPAISSIRVHFPRQSYLAFLPALYQADDESRWFLERMLSIAQTRWDRIDSLIENIAGYFDPKAVPEGKLLAYLARWLALPLEGTWSEEQKRQLLVAAPVFYRRRGTMESLKAYLRVYLQNLSNTTDSQTVDYPRIVECFRERKFLMLSAGNMTQLGEGMRLWGPAVTQRCQLDVFSQVGEVRMVATGDPEHDVFQRFAHHFRVFIPAAWVRSVDDENKIRRALDTEKPAHTNYDLCLVEPRFRVGVQSTVGIDTVVGALPVARLGCASVAGQPHSLEPASRLGYDMVLGARPAPPRTFPLAPDTRLEIDTTLK
jgi:phage tail-like protein